MKPEFGSQPPIEDQDLSKVITRRNVLIGLGVLGAGAGVEALRRRRSKVEESKSQLEEEAEDGEVRQDELVSEPEIIPAKKKYPSGKLKGKKLPNLFGTYTGAPKDKVGDTIEVDFNEQLRKMWSAKREWMIKKSKIPERKVNNYVAVQTGRRLRSDYAKKRELATVKEYLQEIQIAIAEVKQNMDWQKLARIKGLVTEELELVKKISLAITEKDILAYALTELMPSADGDLNAEVLEFLLKNAGKGYVESIPAMYDKKTSFGPYQFTEFALYEKGNSRRGASVVNGALPDNVRIPGSVAKLRGSAHHKAAYMFMVDNICNLINRALLEKVHKTSQKGLFRRSGRENNCFEVLNNKWPGSKEDIMVFTALAHHLPYPAQTIALNWLKSGGRGKVEDYVKIAGSLAQRDLPGYAKKTRANLKALSRY
jgi:hypothetical protein